MDKLHAKYIKFVNTGGDLGAASELKLAKDAVVLKQTGVVHEHVTSDNPNPEDVTEIGTNYEIRGVLAAASQAHMVEILGGAENSSVYTKSQAIRTLPKKDIRLAVYRKTDGLLVLKDLTNMTFVPEVEESYESGKQFYLPFVAKSTATTDYTSDNSAV